MVEAIEFLRGVFKRKKDREPPERPAYIRNLLMLGKMTAAYGTPQGTEETTIHRQLVSSNDPTTGFETDLYYLLKPSEIYKIQNNDYPYFVLTQKGLKAPGLFRGSSFPSKPITLILKSDGLTHLEVKKYPWTQEIISEVMKFTRPEETFEEILGVTRRRQYTYDNSSYIGITAEPHGWCPRAQDFLDSFTMSALSAFVQDRKQLTSNDLMSGTQNNLNDVIF